MDELELWGGHECTVNRVGQRFTDQTWLSGHHDRLDDLTRFASLGLRRLRYPVLWERTAPEHPASLDFAWSDARMRRLGELELSPILGLVHHGGGPAYTHLMDDGFAPGLARFARRVAERYPHVEDWTPVNEPLTTARFSCLYGHWFPHLKDERAFWIALLNQIDGTRGAMREIRAVNPNARLIQTEDLGRTYATARVQNQVDYDNARRWMTWDLLCGRVLPGHDLWSRLCAFGLEDRLRRVAGDPCVPDVVGVNHYLTSERFLDHRCERYPPELVGGNQDLAFADVEAVRVMSPPPAGLAGVLREASDRYGLPIAVTECHNGCTREEQMRWFAEAWDTAVALRDERRPIVAVTAWSLLGAFDWDSMLTRERGSYETGVFDLTGGAPRETAMADLLRALAGGGPRPVPASGEGWWRRDVRLEHKPAAAAETAPVRKTFAWKPSEGRLLITGATGVLGQALARACELRGLAYVLTSRADLDLENADQIEAALAHLHPWAVINAAGWVRVDDGEHETSGCRAVNADGAAALARACARHGALFVGLSSDLVFDGAKQGPYLETDQPRPLNAYGRSKWEAEQKVLAAGSHLIIRTSAFFSPYDRHNFAVQALARLQSKDRFAAPDDLVVSPTYVPDLVRSALDLAIDRATGVWHLANRGAVTWADFARELARAVGADPSLVEPTSAQAFGWTAPRPAYSALGSVRGDLMPSLASALERFARIWTAQ